MKKILLFGSLFFLFSKKSSAKNLNVIATGTTAPTGTDSTNKVGVVTEKPTLTSEISAGRKLTVKGSGVNITHEPKTNGKGVICELPNNEFIGYSTGWEKIFDNKTYLMFKSDPQSSLAKSKLQKDSFYWIEKISVNHFLEDSKIGTTENDYNDNTQLFDYANDNYFS